MKSTLFFAAASLSLFAPALGQSEAPAPSPTNSYGCEPHGDHWHCSGAITPTTQPITVLSTPTSLVAVTTTSSHSHSDHDDDDHDHSSTSALAPSPTNSVGCEPHGGHWHCSAARTTSGTVAAVTSTSSHSSRTGTLAPSPTNSVGCEPHGDHWHCSAPATAVTGVATSITSSSLNATSTGSGAAATTSLLSTNGGEMKMAGLGVVAGALMLAVSLV